MAAVTLRGLTKEFPGGVRALDALDLSIVDGEFFALLGPSGCGKTTLLRTIAGLEAPSAGEVRIGDRTVTALPPGARNVAMVFQDYALFPHMTVVDNIAYPLRIRRQPRPERTAHAREVGGQLGLDGLMARRPAQLSGGQQQRVALARAVACQPTVFLFDEPLSNLDARLRLEARTFLKRLQRDLAVTTVFVTHDQAEALALADRIAVMEAGRIRQLGTPREVFLRPANTFVANFIGSTPMNLRPGRGGRTGDRGGTSGVRHGVRRRGRTADRAGVDRRTPRHLVAGHRRDGRHADRRDRARRRRTTGRGDRVAHAQPWAGARLPRVRRHARILRTTIRAGRARPPAAGRAVRSPRP